MPTANPALSPSAFRSEADVAAGPATMTVAGAAAKSAALTVLLVAAGAVSWKLTMGGSPEEGYDPLYRMLFGLVAPLVGFVVALVTIFVPRVSPFTAPVYAVLEGLFLGAVSAFVNARYQGIVLEAVLLTAGTLGVMAVLYASRWIVVTDKLRVGIIAATGAVCLAYLASFLLNLFGVNFPYLHDSGLFSIGFSLVVVVIAALNLVLDFDTIETGARLRAPKYMEWYAAFGLLVTLIWLYLEVLRLLAKLRGRD
jgi:uncharacterized YccA/Bax inhibitor family protein